MREHTRLLPATLRSLLFGAPEARLRDIAAAAASVALDAVPEHPAALDVGLARLRQGQMDARTIESVQRQAAELDERYLASYTSEAAGWEADFSLARAAAALAEAFDPDPMQAAANSVYEALHAIDREPELLVEAIRAVLKTGSPP